MKKRTFLAFTAATFLMLFLFSCGNSGPQLIDNPTFHYMPSYTKYYYEQADLNKKEIDEAGSMEAEYRIEKEFDKWKDEYKTKVETYLKETDFPEKIPFESLDGSKHKVMDFVLTKVNRTNAHFAIKVALLEDLPVEGWGYNYYKIYFKAVDKEGNLIYFFGPSYQYGSANNKAGTEFELKEQVYAMNFMKMENFDKYIEITKEEYEQLKKNNS